MASHLIVTHVLFYLLGILTIDLKTDFAYIFLDPPQVDSLSEKYALLSSSSSSSSSPIPTDLLSGFDQFQSAIFYYSLENKKNPPFLALLLPFFLGVLAIAFIYRLISYGFFFDYLFFFLLIGCLYLFIGVIGQERKKLKDFYQDNLYSSTGENSNQEKNATEKQKHIKRSLMSLKRIGEAHLIISAIVVLGVLIELFNGSPSHST